MDNFAAHPGVDAFDLFAHRALVPRAQLCGAPAYGRQDFKIYSGAPEFYRIYRVEHGEDIIMSKPLGIDRTQSLAFKAIGPQLSRLFDGGAQLISIAALPWTRREVWLD